MGRDGLRTVAAALLGLEAALLVALLERARREEGRRVSGGHFDYQTVPDALLGAWRDEEVNAVVRDLFDGGEFSVRGYGGLKRELGAV